MQTLRQFPKFLVLADFKKVPTGNARIVFLVVNVARSQVERRQMRGKKGNIRTVNFRNPILMRAAGVKMRLAMIGTNHKAASTTRRVQNYVFRLADAKGVHHVNQVFAGVMLAEFVAFFRRNQPLENAAQNVRADFLEIERAQFFQNRTPSVRREFVRKNQRTRPIVFGWIEKRFIITGFIYGVLKFLLEMDV